MNHMNETTNTIIQKENAMYPYWVFKNDVDKDICNKIISYGQNKWIKAKDRFDSNFYQTLWAIFNKESV